MSRRSLLICASTSRSGSLIKPLVASHFHGHVKKYHKGAGKEELIEKERAQSTAEVMKQLSEDKEESERTIEDKSHQGFVSQTSDKLSGAVREATGGSDNPEAVKAKYKERGPGETYHKPRDDGGVGPGSV